MLLDGAALGTLMIGLDSAREVAESSETSVRHPARRSRPAVSTLRVRLAIALRFAADQLDRTPSATLGSSSSAA